MTFISAVIVGAFSNLIWNVRLLGVFLMAIGAAYFGHSVYIAATFERTAATIVSIQTQCELSWRDNTRRLTDVPTSMIIPCDEAEARLAEVADLRPSITRKPMSRLEYRSDDGQLQTTTRSFRSLGAPDAGVGTTVDIFYNPADPGRVAPPMSWVDLALMLAAVTVGGMLFFGPGVLSVLLSAFFKAPLPQLLSEAEIARIYVSPSARPRASFGTAGSAPAPSRYRSGR